MNTNHIIPNPVLKEAEFYIDRFGGTMNKIGEENGSEYYIFDPEKEEEIGLPVIVQYRYKKAMLLPPDEAIIILNQFASNISR